MILLVNLSGRGDKDMTQAQRLLGAGFNGRVQSQHLLGDRA
jgi:hypothetical protein